MFRNLGLAPHHSLSWLGGFRYPQLRSSLPSKHQLGYEFSQGSSLFALPQFPSLQFHEAPNPAVSSGFFFRGFCFKALYSLIRGEKRLEKPYQKKILPNGDEFFMVDQNITFDKNKSEYFSRKRYDLNCSKSFSSPKSWLLWPEWGKIGPTYLIWIMTTIHMGKSLFLKHQTGYFLGYFQELSKMHNNVFF